METIKEIVEDVLLELYGGESKRPIGVGVPMEKYVVDRLEEVRERLFYEKDSEQDIRCLTQKRNKLNRKISALKKAIHESGKQLCVNCGKEIPLEQEPFCSDKCLIEANEYNDKLEKERLEIMKSQ